MSSARTHAIALLCAGMLSWSGQVVAGDLAYGAGLMLIYDSNITRVPVDPISEVTRSVFAGLAYVERTADAEVRLLAQAERRDYVNNTFSADRSYYVNGIGLWRISPRQVTWVVEDVAQQVLLDIAAPDTPSNRTNANSFSTGPDLQARLNPIDTLTVGMRYGRFDVTGPGDNYRYTLRTRLTHQFSPVTALSVSYDPNRLYFSDPAALYTIINRQDAYLTFESKPYQNNVTIDAGTTRVQPAGGDSHDGRLVRIALARQFAPGSGVQISAADQISDTFTDILGGLLPVTAPGSGLVTPNQPVTSVTGDIYHTKRVNFLYANLGARFGAVVRAQARSLDYQTLAQDFTEQSGRLEISWAFFDDMLLRGYAEHINRRFTDTGQHDVERNGSVGVLYKVTRTVNLTAEIQRLDRTSNVPEFTSLDWRGIMILSYSTGTLYTPASRR